MKRLFDKPEYKWIYYAHASHPKYLRKEVHEWNEERWNEYAELLSSPKCIAVGETGLDYSYSSFCLEHQKLQKNFLKFLLTMQININFRQYFIFALERKKNLNIIDVI